MCSIRGTWKNVEREKSISIRTKMKLYYALVVPVLLYGSECWCLRKEDERRVKRLLGAEEKQRQE